MKLPAFATSITFALLSAATWAQQTPPKPSPEEVKQLMQASMGAKVAVMGPMTEAMLEAQLATAAKPETAERIATFKKNLYEALLKKGFKPEDALQLVVSTPIPNATPGSK